MSNPSDLSIRDLADGAAHADLLGADAAVVDPILVVDLDRRDVSDAELRRAEARARECDRILVGKTAAADGAIPAELRPLAEALDVTLARAAGLRCVVAATDPEAEAVRLRLKVEAASSSALVLAQLLRTGESLAVREALDLESLAYSTLLAGPQFARWLAARGSRPASAAQSADADADAVLIQRDRGDSGGDTLRLTLNRPERRNAHSRELRDALVAGLRIAELDQTIAEVVLAGAGPSFCSGGDLDEFGTATDLATAHLIRTRAGAARPLHALRDRVTARIHGHCVGAGIELPAFAGRVIADPATVMRLPELEMGLIPGAGGTVSIPRRIGRWRALHMMLTGDPVSAPLARQWGLVDEIAAVAPMQA